MALARGIVRFIGWLLTPLVAWAASFIGAWLGTGIAGSVTSSTTGAWLVVALGAGFGIVAAWAWLRYLRLHPRLQKTLAVSPEGMPLAAVEDEPPEQAP